MDMLMHVDKRVKTGKIKKKEREEEKTRFFPVYTIRTAPTKRPTTAGSIIISPRGREAAF
jgi:hypothetical protein